LLLSNHSILVLCARNEDDARNWLDGYLRPEGFAIVWSVDLSISVAIVVTTTRSDDDNGVWSLTRFWINDAQSGSPESSIPACLPIAFSPHERRYLD